jgi:hypothetical protein
MYLDIKGLRLETFTGSSQPAVIALICGDARRGPHELCLWPVLSVVPAARLKSASSLARPAFKNRAEGRSRSRDCDPRSVGFSVLLRDHSLLWPHEPWDFSPASPGKSIHL